MGIDVWIVHDEEAKEHDQETTLEDYFAGAAERVKKYRIYRIAYGGPLSRMCERSQAYDKFMNKLPWGESIPVTTYERFIQELSEEIDSFEGTNTHPDSEYLQLHMKELRDGLIKAKKEKASIRISG